jgi:hypothetical protein
LVLHGAGLTARGSPISGTLSLQALSEPEKRPLPCSAWRTRPQQFPPMHFDFSE